MSTKTELSEKINNTLGLDLDSLIRMTKEDLGALYTALSPPSEDSSKEGDLLTRPLREILHAPLLGKSLGELTLVELFDAFLTRKGGPLGLGILPAVLKGRKKG